MDGADDRRDEPPPVAVSSRKWISQARGKWQMDRWAGGVADLLERINHAALCAL